MANVIALAIGQYNGSFTVTGDIAATGYYSVGQTPSSCLSPAT